MRFDDLIAEIESRFWATDAPIQSEDGIHPRASWFLAGLVGDELIRTKTAASRLVQDMIDNDIFPVDMSICQGDDWIELIRTVAVEAALESLQTDPAWCREEQRRFALTPSSF